MLYDAHGRPIAEAAPRSPKPGMFVRWEDSDQGYLSTAGRALTPEKVDAIMQAADSGDTARMCALAEQIDDRSLAIGAALDTRRAAVAATRWRLAPADDSSRAEEVARAAEQMLRASHPGNELLTFGQMVHLELGSALLPGFAAPEIVWSRGGTEILGFNSVPAKHFTFGGGRTPKLVTTEHPSGVGLEPGKFVLHWHRAKGGSPTRGGLIRACAWLRCFESLNMKDALRFAERYGMPFLVARVDENSWKNERTVLRRVVRNFGPDGGAVLSRGTELDLLQAANNNGDIYFRLLEYLQAAAERLILGQTGTSGEGGWSNNGAQHLVRMDIRDSDCTQIAETAYARILVPWTAWNRGPDAPAPTMEYDVEEAKDAKAEADVIKTLDDAGWELEAEQVEKNTGYRVTRRRPPAEQPARSLALEAETNAPDRAEEIAGKALPQARKACADMLAGLQDRLDELAGIADPAEFATAAEALSTDLAGMLGDGSTEMLERMIAETIRGGAAAGMAARLNELEDKRTA